MKTTYVFPILLVFLLVVAVLAFFLHQQIRVVQPMESPAVSTSGLPGILADLRSGNSTVAEAAKRRLFELRYKADSLTLDEGLQAIRAAAEPLPPEKPDPEVSEHLLDVVQQSPRAQYIPLVVELFSKFSDRAKWWAQAILTGLNSREAAIAYMQIVRTHARAGRIPRLLTGPLEIKPRHGDVFFPELLEYADIPEFSSGIYLLCLTFIHDGQVKAEALKPFAPQFVKTYKPLADWLQMAQQEEEVGWMWTEEYMNRRHPAGILLDLFGYCPAEEVEQGLRSAVELQDPKLKYFALVSLLRLGKKVDNESLDAVAASPEVRNVLYLSLRELNKLSLFPEKFRTQEAFAESNMVEWLAHPSELGQVPDEIELMKVVSMEGGQADDIYDYYLFRFKTTADTTIKGQWVAAVSGPFRRKDGPSTESLGDTFSTFTPWDSKKPEQHMADIRELMKKWREYHAKEAKQ